MITNIDDKLDTCGIYIIEYDNDKVYIGQSTNIRKRAYEHNTKNKQVCDKALKRHNAQIRVLEKVKDINLLDSIEEKWITYYDATNREKGYNIVANGNVSQNRGSKNPNSSLSEEQVNEIVELLVNNLTMSYIDIAKKYNVSQNCIYRISYGIRYYNPKLTYPLRANNHTFLKKDSYLDYFDNIETLLQLKEDLLYRWDLTIERDLPKIYNIPLQALREINNGKKFPDIGNYAYPIRGKSLRNNKKITIEEIKTILSELRNTSMSMSAIGQLHSMHRNTVSNINKGITYPIKNYSYPARQT